MRTRTREPSAPRKRRHLLRALSETPVLPNRAARVTSDASSRLTLGVVVRRDPVYAPPTPLLDRIGTTEKPGCEPPRRSVLVAAKVEHPPHDRIDPLLGVRTLHPPRSAPNLLHQLLRGLWSLDSIPAAEVPDAGKTEACGAEQRPPRASAPLVSQVPPREEVFDVAEPPQAEARKPQTCERPCGPVGPGARQLAARGGKLQRLDPDCAREQKFEGQYTPFVPDRPDSRGKPGAPLEHVSPCPCECVCTPNKCVVHSPPISIGSGSGLLGAIDAAFGWLRCFVEGLMAGSAFPDMSLGAHDQAGTVAVHGAGTSPAVDSLRGGQSPGLGIFAGRELDLGLMRPALSLAALATAGIPGPAAIAAPELPDGDGSLVVARYAEAP